MSRVKSPEMLASLRRMSQAICSEAEGQEIQKPRAKALPLGLGRMDEMLPEAGLPRGSVVEFAAPRGLGGVTTLALSACASAQAEARLRGGDSTAGAFCAWIEPCASLFAPAVARAGVDLSRLLVVRPDINDLAKVSVRIASSHIFKVVVVDTVGLPGAPSLERLDRWANVVRRLSLSIEKSDTTIVLITDSMIMRSLPLPVAMRLEVQRLSEERLSVRVAKERRGRISPPVAVELRKTA